MKQINRIGLSLILIDILAVLLNIATKSTMPIEMTLLVIVFSLVGLLMMAA